MPSRVTSAESIHSFGILRSFGFRDFEKAIEADMRARLLSGEQAEQMIADKKLQMRLFEEESFRGYGEAQLDLRRQKLQPPEAYASPFGLADIYARLGLKDAAFNSLQRALDSKDVQLTQTDIEPAFDSLRGEPRFQALPGRLALR